MQKQFFYASFVYEQLSLRLLFAYYLLEEKKTLKISSLAKRSPQEALPLKQKQNQKEV